MSIENQPSRDVLLEYLGEAINTWDELIKFIDENYGFESMWNYSKKHDEYEFKYRRGGKTLVTFYIKKDALTVLVIFGKAEREKFENSQHQFSPGIVDLYMNTHQYHDGKWLWIALSDKNVVEDIKKLIMIKRKPIQLR